MMQDNKRIKLSSEEAVIDNPCWGSPTTCSLKDLLKLLDRSSAILVETDDYLVLCKPPDLRMDGDYPASVHKLLTYWYPSSSLRNSTNLLDAIAQLTKLNDLPDNALRPCHQLDYATSGVLLVGRNRKAAAKACEAFRERTTQKEYLAVCTSHVCVKDYQTLELTEEDVYRHIRRYDQQMADRRKANRKTFNGYQPASSIFLKWKVMKTSGKRPRDAEMVQRVEEKVSKEDLDAMKEMKWSEIKRNDSWKQVFEEAAHVYNQSLEQEQQAQGGEIETKPPELPPVFRLSNVDDPNTFYVNAALAPQPDQFAMKIHPNALVQDQAPVDATLAFKHAITKCKVITHTTLNGKNVTKMQLSPLTGRRHQLRCHMVLVGAPIVGDATYCLDSEYKVERMCLHAYSLKLPDLLDVQAPDPFVVKDDKDIEVRMI